VVARGRESSGVKSSIRRGDVFVVRLDPTIGSEIQKTRPGVILSNDQACRHDAVVQIVPVTGLPNRSLRPYEAELGSTDSGLEKPSRAVGNQVRTVAKERLLRRLGRLTPAEMKDLETAIEIQLGLRSAKSR
jgi:mRNA interferase MazF